MGSMERIGIVSVQFNRDEWFCLMMKELFIIFCLSTVQNEYHFVSEDTKEKNTTTKEHTHTHRYCAEELTQAKKSRGKEEE